MSSKLFKITLLNLGCGNNIMVGWDNLDIQAKPNVIACDLTKPLPYKDASVDVIYSEHFIEHISHSDGLNLLKECYRILKKSGCIRISTPDLDELVKCYSNHDILRYRETGWVPSSRCMLLNQGMREWGHTYLYNEEELIRSFIESGFKHISKMERGISNYIPLQELETRPNCNDLIIEAIKQ